MTKIHTVGRHSFSIACGIRCAALAVMLVAGSACIKNPESRGYALEYADFDKVKPGMSKEETLNILGSPSSTSNFGDETWYYIGMKMERVAFLTPELEEQQAFAVTFNKQGTVETTTANHGESNRNIAFAKDRTSTEGNKVTVAEQLLGNLGRFNADSKTKRQVKPRY